MLKIRDDVDLKELEKFGFELISIYYIKKLGTSGNETYIKVLPLTKIILIETETTCINEIDVLYDLIQAGLVEKVEE